MTPDPQHPDPQNGDPQDGDPQNADPIAAVVIAGQGSPPAWAERVADLPVVRADESGGLQSVLAGTDAVLIDARVEAPLALARRIRRASPELQLILVADAEAGRALHQAMIFTPGLGEPWMVDPSDVTPELVERAGKITRQRRSHARQLARVSGRVAVLQAPDRRRSRMSDQYLATLLELLPEPVFALDENDEILFANPIARSVFGSHDTDGSGQLRDILAPADPGPLDSLLRKRESGVVRAELRLRDSHGDERIFNAALAPVGAERPARALVLHDVTDQIRARETLEDQALELEAQATELAAQTEEASRQTERTGKLAAERTAVLGNIADGVIIVDANGLITFVNDAAARLHGVERIGITPEEWPKAYNLMTLDGKPYPADDLPLARALRQGETVRDAEWLISRPDGVTVHAQGSAAPVVNRDGHAVGAVLTVRDVTEQREREAERERLLDERDKALAELQDAMRHRSRFYASMSHELRTPINAIIGYNQLLTDEVYGPIPESQQTALERIDRAARHLLELVNDVLDLSKIEAGKMVLAPEDVRIGALIQDLEATMEPLAREYDVNLRFDLADACDRPVSTDPRRLRQILLNLLSNAIRYGTGAPVDVTCQGEDGIRISVRDQGPGIDQERIEDIFDEFVQLDNADRGGTGLGLPIARNLARFLGGDIEVESEPGVGSTFILVLPENPPT
jgi:PAS domain S-box-containing protein